MFSATVVVTTRNRRSELRTALESAVAQSSRPEVLVIDDGSTDGTADMVSADFPSVRLVRHADSRGLIVRRNEGARLAAGDVVFSIDDDAEFSSQRVVAQTLEDFDHPRIGAVAIPYLEPRKDKRLHQSAPDGQQTWITSQFIGTAHALRRDTFLALGGYREDLFHQGEEGDFAVRMLAAGYVTRLGCSDPIIHWESARRDHWRMDFYGPRNSILFAWQNAPWPWLPLNLVATTVNCLGHSLNLRRFRTRSAGVVAGYRTCFKSPRQPVSRQVFHLWRQLRKGAPRTLEQVIGEHSTG